MLPVAYAPELALDVSCAELCRPITRKDWRDFCLQHGICFNGVEFFYHVSCSLFLVGPR